MVELKGQLTIQYLASFIFFIGLIIYIYFAYSANLPAFVEEVRKEDVRSKAYQLSEILINDPGEPINWQDCMTLECKKRIGLSDENSNKTNLISEIKADELQLTCRPPTGSFEDIQQKLALDKPFSIHIFKINQDTGERTLISECNPPDFPKTSINATVKRITVLNNSAGDVELAEIIVQM